MKNLVKLMSCGLSFVIALIIIVLFSAGCSFKASDLEFNLEKLDRLTPSKTKDGVDALLLPRRHMMSKPKSSTVASNDQRFVKKFAREYSKPLRDAWYVELQRAHTAIPFLKNLAKPADPTPRAKWYSSLTPEHVISKVRSMLVTLGQEGPLQKEISEDDLEKESKIGPQGGHPGINSLIPKLAEYFGVYTGTASERTPDLRQQRETFNSPEWIKAKAECRAVLKLNGRLRPASYLNVINKLKSDSKLTTNCGFVPGVSFSKRNKPEVIKRVLELQRDNLWKQPAIIGERSTRGKSRFIFMTSFATNVHGAVYSLVLQDWIRKLNLPAFSAWEGNTSVRRAVTQMFEQGKKECVDKRTRLESGLLPHETELSSVCGETMLSSDFTGMDQRFNRACMLEVYDVIKDAFQPSYRKDLLEVINYIADTPVIFPLEDGTLRESTEEHSLISGSEWTNLIETIFAYIMWIYAKATEKLVLGDDGIAKVAWPMSDTATKFSDLCHEIGMTGNPEKQLVSQNKVHYLQRYYYRNYKVTLDTGKSENGGVYPLMLATNSLLYPERFHSPEKWNKTMETIRNLMIVENTCDHPCFRHFAEFVGKGDKYLQDFLSLSRKKLAEAEKQARSIPGFVPSYNQESASKRIWEFATYRVWLGMK